MTMPARTSDQPESPLSFAEVRPPFAPLSPRPFRRSKPVQSAESDEHGLMSDYPEERSSSRSRTRCRATAYSSGVSSSSDLARPMMNLSRTEDMLGYA